MTAQIIAVANQKGGCGKSTISMMLAGTLGRRGHRVMVVDADAQGTATQYAASAPEEQPFPAAVSGLAAAGNKIHREIRKFVEDYDFIVVDCPPAVDAVTPQSALLVADLALVPIVPSPADLWAAVGTRQLIERIAGVNETIRARLLVNMAQPRTRLAAAVMGQVEQFGIPVLRTRLHSRTAYRQAMALGVLPQDLGPEAKPAALEAEALADEVLKALAEAPALEAVHG
ncbi:MAG TPA: ParA family partition ATPase [Alphaproteobacteria bacterium]|nr:ParA family partition ATPase [Alphaproteobacteria bacterium]